MSIEYELHCRFFVFKDAAVLDGFTLYKNLEIAKEHKSILEIFIKEQKRYSEIEKTKISIEEQNKFHNKFFVWEIIGIKKIESGMESWIG